MFTWTRASVRSGSARAVAVLVQVLALLVGLQISGAIHSAHDVIQSLLEPAACHDSDCSDDAGKCPADCPNCHCAARTNVVPPPVFDATLPAPSTSESPLVNCAADERVHKSPWHSSIYRPPRFALG